MASIYLDANDTNYPIGHTGDSVFGQTGTENIVIGTGVTGIVLDQNVEGVTLAGASSDFTYQQQGNTLAVFSGGVQVATIPLQSDADGTQITATDGTFTAILTGAVMTLGGTTVPTTPGAVVPGGSTPATFTLTPSAASVDEGGTVNVTVAGATANTAYDYTLSGVSAADITGGSLTGSFTTNSSGAASFSVATVADLTTEGAETVTITSSGNTASFVINDTSLTPAGVTKALTANRDIITALTTDDDTVTGAFGTVQAEDIVLDSSTTDNDTATLTIGSNVAVTLANIENVNLDLRGGATVDATNFSGVKTLSVDSNYGESSFTVNELTSGMTVAVDSTVTTGSTTTLDMYLATGGTASKTDAVTLSLGGNVTTTLDKDGSGNNEASDVDILTINSTGTLKNTVALTSTNDFVAATTSESDSIIVTGDKDLVIQGDHDADAESLDGAVLTNSMTGGATVTYELKSTTDLINAEIDLDHVNAIIELDAISDATTNIRVADGATVQTGIAEVVDDGLTITNATAAGTLNFNIKHADTDASVGILTFAQAGTVNITNGVTAASTAADFSDVTIKTSLSGVGNSTDLNIDTGAYGIQFAAIEAVASNTLDAVTITGGKDFTSSTIAANSLNATVEDFLSTTITAAGAVTVAASKTFVAGDIVAKGAITIDAGTTVTLDQVDNVTANTASLTVTAVSNITAADAIGQGANATDFGNVSLTSTGGFVSVEEIDSDGTIALTSAAGFAVNVTSNIAAVGNITIVSGKDINIDSTVDTSGTLSLNGTGTVGSSFDGNITAATVIFDGANHTYSSATNDETITGNVTVQGGASLMMTSGTEILTGTVTHTGSGLVSIQDLAGNYVGGNASGAVDIDDTTSAATSIVTGSGNDNIVIANAAVVNSGAGNDIINASTVGTQVSLNGGAGIDGITGGTSTDDILTGGTGTDTFYYTAASHGSTSEKITDFEIGAAGDIFNITDDTFDGVGDTILATGATVVKIDTTDTTATAIANTGDQGILLFTEAGFANTTAFLAAINGTSGLSEGGDLDDDDFLAVWYDNDGADAGVYLAFLQGDADYTANGMASVSNVVKLGTLGLADIAAITADQFTIA